MTVGYNFSFILLHISTLLVIFLAIIVFRMKPKVQMHYIILIYMFSLMSWNIGILCDSYMQMYFGWTNVFFLFMTHIGVTIVPVQIM